MSPSWGRVGNIRTLPPHLPFANGLAEAQMRHDPGPGHTAGRTHPRTLAHDGLLVHSHSGYDSSASLSPARPLSLLSAVLEGGGRAPAPGM